MFEISIFNSWKKSTIFHFYTSMNLLWKKLHLVVIYLMRCTQDKWWVRDILSIKNEMRVSRQMWFHSNP